MERQFVVATRWLKHGDHAGVFPPYANTAPWLKDWVCPICNHKTDEHGSYMTRSGGGGLCPGDYIVEWDYGDGIYFEGVRANDYKDFINSLCKIIDQSVG